MRKNEKRAIYNVNGEEKTWGDLCRLVASHIDVRLEKIVKDITPHLNDFTIQKDNKRNFSFYDKVNLWISTNGKVRINGEVENKWYKEGEETHISMLIFLRF